MKNYDPHSPHRLNDAERSVALDTVWREATQRLQDEIDRLHAVRADIAGITVTVRADRERAYANASARLTVSTSSQVTAEQMHNMPDGWYAPDANPDHARSFPAYDPSNGAQR